MLYNKEEHSRYVLMAGKISVAAAVIGLAVFIIAFIVDVGSKELSKVSGQTATTTLTVLNTPPSFTVGAYELVESSTSSPTNTDDTIVWQALGSDSNGAPYFLLICSTNATPTANAAADSGSLGTAPPACDAGAIQWGVSTSTVSDTVASVSTTTASTAISQFSEANNWFAWVCDDDPFNPRCNTTPVQGLNATNSSPFNVNNRPNFLALVNDGPVDPGGTLVFDSTSSDPDTAGGADNLILVVCRDAVDYNAVTNDCDANFIASTTINLTTNVSATYTLASIVRDDTYPANGFLIDEHGHEAADNPIASNFVVNNVAPTVLGGDIDLNGGLNLNPSVPGGEDTGFTLDFRIRDANSCVTAASTTDEIAGFKASVFRAMENSTSTCDGESSAQYDPNDCYTTAVATTTWNLSCTAATSSCTGPSIDFLDYTCTFPLWFVADPTDSNPGFTPAGFEADNWTAGISGIDDDNASSSMATTSMAVELVSFTALDLATAEIPYGSLEPGDDSGTLSATTSVLSVGNTGLDQQVQGESMCGTYTISTECPVSATSTIPEFEQKFSSSSLAYTSPGALALSSSSNQEVELDVNKTTSTSTPNNGITYWGIAVPISITLAGNYQGLNTFIGVTAEDADW